MKHALPYLLLATGAFADSPVIEAVQLAQNGSGWRFDVTLSHPDTGWDHYADGWRIELEDGTVAGTRILLHPHETEQPFTRSLSGVAIPIGTARVFVRARCNIDGWTTDVFPVDLR